MLGAHRVVGESRIIFFHFFFRAGGSGAGCAGQMGVC